jgi:release factor glutamine methyltransferase
MTAAEAITEAVRRLSHARIPSDEARREARILVREATGLTNEALYARPEQPLSEDALARWESVVSRREKREPLAYILGYREFYGLTFHVTPAVLIPRPETELLVETALEHLRGMENPVVVDVGTGSGCIAVAIAVHRPDATVYATDISQDALTIARENAQRNGVSIHFIEGDLLAPLHGQGPQFNVIVSNPPYIAPLEIVTLEPEVRDWEPSLALGTHPDPYVIYGQLASESVPLLRENGLLAVEVGQGQADAVAALWSARNLKEIATRSDYAGIPRVVSGTRLVG